MKHMPQFAFYAAVAVLLVGSLASRLSSTPNQHRVALSLDMDSGHLSFKAELGAALIALRL